VTDPDRLSAADAYDRQLDIADAFLAERVLRDGETRMWADATARADYVLAATQSRRDVLARLDALEGRVAALEHPEETP